MGINADIMVCRRCGYMWEPNKNSRRPQCSKCKSSSKRPATPEEVLKYQHGERYLKPDPENQGESTDIKNADSTVDSTSDNADSTADSTVDNGTGSKIHADNAESTVESASDNVLDLDIEGMIEGKHKDTTKECGLNITPEPVKQGIRMNYWIITGAVVVVGAVIGYFLHSRRVKGNPQNESHRPEEPAPEIMTIDRGYMSAPVGLF